MVGTSLPALRAGVTFGSAVGMVSAHASHMLRVYSRRIPATIAAARAGSTYPALLFGIGPVYSEHMLRMYWAYSYHDGSRGSRGWWPRPRQDCRSPKLGGTCLAYAQSNDCISIQVSMHFACAEAVRSSCTLTLDVVVMEG
jgi:hypothetical protein